MFDARSVPLRAARTRIEASGAWTPLAMAEAERLASDLPRLRRRRPGRFRIMLPSIGTLGRRPARASAERHRQCDDGRGDPEPGHPRPAALAADAVMWTALGAETAAVTARELAVIKIAAMTFMGGLLFSRRPISARFRQGPLAVSLRETR